LVEGGRQENKPLVEFFHHLANSNRRNNTVESLEINGTVYSDTTEIREHILQFYNRLDSEQFGWRPKLDGLPFGSISDEEAIWMEKVY
jgi:hypothetical protein